MRRFVVSAALVCAALAAACADLSLEHLENRKVLEAPPDTKVVGVKWDAQGILIIVRPMMPSESPEDWQIHRSSPGELAVRSVIVREHRVSADTLAVFLTAKE